MIISSKFSTKIAEYDCVATQGDVGIKKKIAKR
jgi:hypothetical protein